MRDVEYGVIVDVEDIAPLVKDGHFGEPPAEAPQGVEVLDAVGAREVRVKDERVRDDGHRHAARLDAVLLMDALGYPRADVGAEFYRFAQPLRCGADALFEAVGGVLDGAQGDARLIGEAREVRRAADEPSRVGEPVVLVARRSGEQRVLEAGVGFGGARCGAPRPRGSRNLRGTRTAMAAKMSEPSVSEAPSRSRASSSTVAAGATSVSMTTGADAVAVTRMSGWPREPCSRPSRSPLTRQLARSASSVSARAMLISGSLVAIGAVPSGEA